MLFYQLLFLNKFLLAQQSDWLKLLNTAFHNRYFNEQDVTCDVPSIK